MKKKYIITFAGLICFHISNADIMGTLEQGFSTSVGLAEAGLSLVSGGALAEAAFSTAQTAFFKTLQAGMNIHGSITGNNPFKNASQELAEGLKGTGDGSNTVYNDYKDFTRTHAQVRVSKDICQAEKDFMARRIVSATQAFKDLCNRYGIIADDISPDTMPRIGLCFSGGGCRATNFTAATLQALESTDNNGTISIDPEKSNFLETVMAIACLSGSTWVTFPRATGLKAEGFTRGFKKYVVYGPEVLNKKKTAAIKLSNTSEQSLTLTPGVSDQSLAIVPANSTNNQQLLVVDANASLGRFLPTSYWPKISNYVDSEYSYIMPQSTATNHNLYPELPIVVNQIKSDFLHRELSAMNIYGAFLSHMLGGPFDDKQLVEASSDSYYGKKEPRQQIFLSQIAKRLSDNPELFPLPIGTGIAPTIDTSTWNKIKNFFASSSKKKRSPYQLFEFSPFEVGTRFGSSGAFIPPWAVGREFFPQYTTTKIVSKYKYTKVKHAKARAIGSRAESPYLVSSYKQSQKPSGAYYTQEKVPVYKTVSTKTGIGSTKNPDIEVPAYTYAPEYPLGIFLATFGSAFAVSPADIMNIMDLDSYMDDHHPYIGKILKTMAKAFTFSSAGSVLGKAYNNFRLFPFVIPNFLQSCDDAPCTESKVTIVDAGIRNNLPWDPLLDRGMDIIIAGDASAPVMSVDSKGNKKVDALLGGQLWAQENGIPFPYIDYDQITAVDSDGYATQDIFIFPGTGKVPTIIYIPFLDNPANKSDKKFVEECMKDKCSTFNFAYNKDVIEKIQTHMVNTIYKNGNFKKILQAIADKAGERQAAAAA